MKTLEELAHHFAYCDEISELDAVYRKALYLGFIEGAKSDYVKLRSIKKRADLLQKTFYFAFDDDHDKNAVLDFINIEMAKLLGKSFKLKLLTDKEIEELNNNKSK